MSNPTKILFKYPSRGRPQRFFDGLDSIVNNIADKDFYHISCTLDLNDDKMYTPEIIDRINKYPNTSIEWGESKSKIHAVNRSMPEYDFDILVNMSDDMRFNIYGFDQMIRVDMNYHFPNMDGLLHYPDQDAKEYLATMYIAGKNFYSMFGYIYHPGFKSLWCDNLMQDIAQKLGKYKYLGYQINVHLNPAYGHLEKDSLFLEQQGHWQDDERLYYEIKERGYDLHLLKLKTNTPCNLPG